MSAAVSRLLDRRFRANPAYELVVFDRLPAGEREALSSLTADADLYGILRPREEARLALRSASIDTALLFLTLREPSPLPGYLFARLGDEVEPTTARLVLDGVLEMEHEGGYVSGAGAVHLLPGEHASGGRSRIAELSVAALRYGQEIAALPVDVLAERLYFYGRRPVSPVVRRQVADEGFAQGKCTPTTLRRAWRESDSPSLYWRTFHSRAAPAQSEGEMGYKLYVSPALDGVADAFAAVAESLAGTAGVVAFKVGRGAAGLCRPDKLVAYFARLDDLHRGATMLRERLHGCPAHGVPFTAAVTEDGLLSWGADPPGLPGRSAAQRSWRQWVTQRLAEQLKGAAAGEGGEVEPWQFALDRLRLSGVDTDQWIPSSKLWARA